MKVKAWQNSVGCRLEIPQDVGMVNLMVTTKPFPIFTSTLRKHIQVFSDMLIIGMRVKEALSRI